MLWVNTVLDQLDKIAAGAVAGAGAVAVAWHKLRRSNAGDNRSTAGDDASTAVISMLRNEVQRLSDQNTRLADIVNKLQLQVFALHRENEGLRHDITRLQDASQAT